MTLAKRLYLTLTTTPGRFRRSGATPIVWNDTIFLNVAAQPESGGTS